MAYAINHPKHILSYLSENGMATPTELAAALPRSKRRKCSVQSITYALNSLQRDSRVKRLIHGVYARPFAPFCPADAVVRGDILGQRIIEVFRRSADIGWRVEELVEELDRLDVECTPKDVSALLTRLKRRGVLRRVGRRWAPERSAFVCTVPDLRVQREPEEIDIFS